MRDRLAEVKRGTDSADQVAVDVISLKAADTNPG